jgi:hypothetical protein
VPVIFQSEDRGNCQTGVSISVPDGEYLTVSQAKVLADVRLTESVEVLTRAIQDLLKALDGK